MRVQDPTLPPSKVRDLALSLAREARRIGLATVVWRQRDRLTVDRVDALLADDKYGSILADLTLDEIRAMEAKPSAWNGDANAIIGVFERCSQEWLSSGFFARNMGLPRWTAQAELARLADAGLLERKGKTSGTRYRLAAHLRVGRGSWRLTLT